MGTIDIISGALFAAVSIAIFALTFSFPELTVTLSPTVFPRFVSVSLFILSSFLIAQGILKRTAGRAERGSGDGARARPEPSFILRFILFTASSLLYIVLLEPVGYVIATPPCIACSMLVFGERRVLRIVLVSVIGTAVLYGVFRMFFRVPLPRSPLW